MGDIRVKAKRDAIVAGGDQKITKQKGDTSRRSAGVVVAIVVAIGGIVTALIKTCG